MSLKVRPLSDDVGGVFTSSRDHEGVGDRRVKLKLRAAVNNLESVAAEARSMADGLAGVLSDLAGSDVLSATDELIALRLLAEDVDGLVEKVLHRERQWFLEPVS